VLKADNLTTFMCRLSRNSMSLELLEPESPVRACNGVALPFVLQIPSQHKLLTLVELSLDRPFRLSRFSSIPKCAAHRDVPQRFAQTDQHCCSVSFVSKFTLLDVNNFAKVKSYGFFV
jgi:hypothetical protein